MIRTLLLVYFNDNQLEDAAAAAAGHRYSRTGIDNIATEHNTRRIKSRVSLFIKDN